MRQLYKNLYYDERTNEYLFKINGEWKPVATQEGYLLSYLLEVILNGQTRLPS